LTTWARAGGCAGSNYTFLTSKERDNETGLDYFGARYYASSQGRFTSADPLYIEMGRLGDTQQFNLYSYTRNNPLRLVDPTGLDIEVTGTEQEAYRKRLQQDVSFTVQLNAKTNKVQIVDASGNVLDKNQLKALGKTLKGGEKELFKAITDTKNHVTIDTVRGIRMLISAALMVEARTQLMLPT
jgi:RHS repeat-associated protein